MKFTDGVITNEKGNVIGGMWINPNHPFRDDGKGRCDLCFDSKEACAAFPGRTQPCTCKDQASHDDWCPLNAEKKEKP